MRRLCLSLFLAFIGLGSPLAARTWTLADQRTFEAEYVSSTATHVTVKVPDGRVIPVELTRFSQADRDFVAQQLAAAKVAPSQAVPKPPGAPLAPAKPSAIKGPYAEFVTGEWKQFEGKGDLQCMLFASPTLDATKKFPLLIYLHGKGNRVLTREHLGFAATCAKPDNYSQRPCFILAPQCPDENGWSGTTGINLLKTIKEMQRTLPIDPDRLYLVGYSMGGYGTFALLNDEPRMFAAGIPIAGGANVSIARNLRRIPLWIFHGEKDEVVSPDGSRAMAKALEKMKAPAKYTEFPGAGHGLGGQINDDPEVHRWLFAQARK